MNKHIISVRQHFSINKEQNIMFLAMLQKCRKNVLTQLKKNKEKFVANTYETYIRNKFLFFDLNRLINFIPSDVDLYM